MQQLHLGHSNQSVSLVADKGTVIDNLCEYRKDKLIHEALQLLKPLIYDKRADRISDQIRRIVGLLEKSMDERDVRRNSYFVSDQQNCAVYARLLEDYPTLSIGERRICLLIMSHMSTKEISMITLQSIDAINKARIRLRKKFGLTGRDTSLIEFLDHYRDNKFA